MISFPVPKTVAEVLDYEIDWTATLAGDTIATASVTLSRGTVTIASVSNTG